MAGLRPFHWHPFAAYLYLLHLDGPALAWEYLRRHPDYGADWHRHRHKSPHHAARWGLRLLEDPTRDARDAYPDWLDGPALVQLHPDADPAPNAPPFRLWDIPGHKQLHQNDARLRLTVRAPGRSARLALAPTLRDGLAYTQTQPNTQAVRGTQARDAPLDELTAARDRGLALERPSADALLELHTLQALDGHLAGASAQEIARAMFGPGPDDWYADGGLRSKVRRLLRRGQRLMAGDYRRLLQIHPLEQGRLLRTPNDRAQNASHS